MGGKVKKKKNQAGKRKSSALGIRTSPFETLWFCGGLTGVFDGEEGFVEWWNSEDRGGCAAIKSDELEGAPAGKAKAKKRKQELA